MVNSDIEAPTSVGDFKTWDDIFQKSFACPTVESEDDLPMPNATCKMMASCGKTASYKISTVIACPEHATADMHPFTPTSQKRKQVQDDPDL